MGQKSRYIVLRSAFVVDATSKKHLKQFWSLIQTLITYYLLLFGRKRWSLVRSLAGV